MLTTHVCTPEYYVMANPLSQQPFAMLVHSALKRARSLAPVISFSGYWLRSKCSICSTILISLGLGCSTASAAFSCCRAREETPDWLRGWNRTTKPAVGLCCYGYRQCYLLCFEAVGWESFPAGFGNPGADWAE